MSQIYHDRSAGVCLYPHRKCASHATEADRDRALALGRGLPVRNATYTWLRLATRALLVCAGLYACARTASGTHPTERLSYGSFHELRIYRASAPAQHLALLLSGDGGWGAPPEEIAQRLSEEGALVAGIDVRDLFARFERNPGACVSPGTQLADLAHFLERRYALPRTPAVLIGHSAGATLAYIALAQSPAGTFAGALTLSFCADLDLAKPVCDGLVRSMPRGDGVRLLPSAAALPAPWIALHGLDDEVCPAAEARAFAAAVPGTRFIALPQVDHRYHHASRWWPTFEAGWRQLLP